METQRMMSAGFGALGVMADNTIVLVADNTNKIAATTAQVTKLIVKQEVTDKTIKEVQSRILKIENEIKATAKAAAAAKAAGTRSVPTFPMSPRPDARGIDPLQANDAWATGRAGIGYNGSSTAQTRNEGATSSGSAWNNWQRGDTPLRRE